MSLRVRDRRRLSGIQGALGRSDPRLTSLFATFSQLTRDEEMPHLERLRVRADRFTARGGRMKTAVLSQLRVILIAPVALAATTAALLIGGWSSNPGACRVAPVAHSSHGRAPARPKLALCLPDSWRPAMMAAH